MSTAVAPAKEHHPREIFIYVNTARVGPFTADEVTGAQIKEKAGLALDGELSKQTEQGFEPVANDQTIRIHEDERFKYVPPTPGSR